MTPPPFASPNLTGIPSCAEAVDPDLWFPNYGGPLLAAKRVCRGCEVVDGCLAWALDNNERHGIWGGLSARERGDILRRRRAAA